METVEEHSRVLLRVRAPSCVGRAAVRHVFGGQVHDFASHRRRSQASKFGRVGCIHQSLVVALDYVRRVARPRRRFARVLVLGEMG